MTSLQKLIVAGLRYISLQNSSSIFTAISNAPRIPKSLHMSANRSAKYRRFGDPIPPTSHHQYPQHHFRILKLEHDQIDLLQSLSYPTRHEMEERGSAGHVAQEVIYVDGCGISEHSINRVI